MDQDSEKYIPEKLVWTHEDYEQMGWHDCPIYGMVFQSSIKEFSSDLIFDIDYIFKWVNPTHPNHCFKFWISPCTLCFKDVYDLSININSGSYGDLYQIIFDIKLSIEKSPIADIDINNWEIVLLQGYIKFKSQGFEQIVRKPAVLTDGQTLDLEERGNINFSLSPYEL